MKIHIRPLQASALTAAKSGMNQDDEHTQVFQRDPPDRIQKHRHFFRREWIDSFVAWLGLLDELSQCQRGIAWNQSIFTLSIRQARCERR